MSGAIGVPVPDPGLAMRDRYFAMMGIGPLTEEQHKRLNERVGLATSSFLTEKGTARLKKLDKRTRVELEAKAKQDQGVAKKDASGEKDKVLYDDRLRRSNVALDMLRGYAPASDAMVAAFEKAHDAAAVLAGGLRWADGFKKLHDVHIGDAVEKADGLWAESDKQGRKAAAGAFTLIDEAGAMLRAAPLMTSAGGNAGGTAGIETSIAAPKARSRRHRQGH